MSATELTRAEIIALDMTSRGQTQRSIARDLGKRTENAVSTMLCRARRKLGALSTPHAIRLAMEAGILRPGPIRGDHT